MDLEFDMISGASGQLFKMLTESATDIIWIIDINTLKLTYLSPSVYKIRGYTPDEVVGVTIDAILTPECLIKAKEMLNQVLTRDSRGEEDPEQVYFLDFQEYRKDGSIMSSEARMRLIRDDAGKPVGIYGITRDVTEDRQLREALRIQNETFTAVFESIPYIASLVDIKGNVIDINSRSLSVAGKTKEELLGLPGGLVYNCVNAFRSEGCGNTPMCKECPIRTRMKYTFETGKSIYEEEGIIVAEFGGQQVAFNLLISTTLVKTTQGDCVLLVVNNNTERKKAEEALKASEKRYAVLFESSPVALVEADFSSIKQHLDRIRERGITDVRGYLQEHPDEVVMCADSIKVLNINQNMLNLLKSAGKTPIQDNVAPYFHSESASEFLEELVALSNGANKYECQLRFKAIDGNDYILNTITSVVHGHEDTLSRVMMSMHDITENVEIGRVKDELYRKEHHIAQTLQNALIPSELPDFKGCSVSVKYHPASNESQVGGDFYDVFVLSENRLGILIGDVVGKGLAAANRIAAARYTIRSYAYLNSSPSWVLTQSNNALCREIENNNSMSLMFTAFYLVVDTNRHTLRFASGGSEPPLILDSNGQIHELQVNGHIMGVWQNHIYQEAEYMLGFGDTLVMTTDGITESKSVERGYFGPEGVVNCLSQSLGQSTEQITSGIMDAAISYTGGSLNDDAVVIALALENR